MNTTQSQAIYVPQSQLSCALVHCVVAVLAVVLGALSSYTLGLIIFQIATMVSQ
ncbi:MAG TPA: hypothetical protein V6D22_25790 [Candidatus Obscuribacterales bacterium]